MAKKNIGKNIVSVLPGVLVIAVAAGALTYGAKVAVAEATKPKAVAVKTVTVSEAKDASSDTTATDSSTGAAASGSTSTSSTTTTTTPATPPATPESTTKTATTNSFVYLRPGAAASGTPLKDLEKGTVVQYETESTTLWQKVTVNGTTGYVFKKWLTY